MFNDPLSVEECSNLVRRLAGCAFPFQCAHGRPSMVPLAHLSQDSALGPAGLEEGKTPERLLDALKKWKCSMKRGV